MQLFWFERQNLQLAQVLIFAAVCSRVQRTFLFHELVPEFCPETLEKQPRRRRRDQGDVKAHTWQWKVKPALASQKAGERLPQIGDVFPRTCGLTLCPGGPMSARPRLVPSLFFVA
jgi:hypothetical protein